MRIVAISGVIAIWLAIGLMLYVDYLSFWPVQKLVITSDQPVALNKNIVHPGETLSYNLSYCKYHNYQTTVHRTFIDGQVIALTDTPGKLPLGCSTVQVGTSVVPETINPGQYHMVVDVEQRVNFLRTVDTVYETQVFTVVPRAPGDPWRDMGNAENITVIK